MCENLNLGEKGNLGGEMIEETDSLEKLSLEDEIMSLKKIKPPKMEVALQHCETVPNKLHFEHCRLKTQTIIPSNFPVELRL